MTASLAENGHSLLANRKEVKSALDSYCFFATDGTYQQRAHRVVVLKMLWRLNPSQILDLAI